jgi:molecular chaperone HtpG
MLKAHQQLDNESPRILELNPNHPLIKKLVELAGPDGKGDIGEAAELLLDQARILEGERVEDPTAFARRLSEVMVKGF